MLRPFTALNSILDGASASLSNEGTAKGIFDATRAILLSTFGKAALVDVGPLPGQAMTLPIQRKDMPDLAGEGITKAPSVRKVDRGDALVIQTTSISFDNDKNEMGLFINRIHATKEDTRRRRTTVQVGCGDKRCPQGFFLNASCLCQAVDTGPDCPAGFSLEDGVCVEDTGLNCQAPLFPAYDPRLGVASCVECTTTGGQCPPGQICVGGRCIDRPPVITPCPEGQVRDEDGNCVPETMPPPPCPTGQVRDDDGKCVEPCECKKENPNCPAGFSCQDIPGNIFAPCFCLPNPQPTVRECTAASDCQCWEFCHSNGLCASGIGVPRILSCQTVADCPESLGATRYCDDGCNCRMGGTGGTGSCDPSTDPGCDNPQPGVGLCDTNEDCRIWELCDGGACREGCGELNVCAGAYFNHQQGRCCCPIDEAAACDAMETMTTVRCGLLAGCGRTGEGKVSIDTHFWNGVTCECQPRTETSPCVFLQACRPPP